MKAARRAKALLKSAFPGGAAAYRRLRAALAPRRRDLRAVFTDISRHHGWQDEESASGRGSTLARTEAVRRELPRLLAELGARGRTLTALLLFSRGGRAA